MSTTLDYTNDTEWLMKRQREYDKRMSDYGAKSLEPRSFAMFATHAEAVMEIDCLPISEGGRK